MDDVARGAPPVAVLSYSLWQRTFAGDTTVIGKKIQLNAREYTIVGIMPAALLVLLVTCVNVAGLFLSRAAARRRELGVRVALGASRARLLRQLLTESMVYGIAGGVAGIALAFLTRSALVQVAAPSLPP